MRLPYAAIFSQYFAFGAIVTLLPLLLRSLDLTSLHFSILLGSFAVVFVLVLIFLGHLSDSIGRVKPAALGLLLSSAGVLTLPFSGSLALMIVSMVMFGVGYGLFFPSLSALVADNSSPEEYGRATGLYHALLTIGVTVGAAVMGWVASQTGARPALSLASIPLFLALALAISKLTQKPRV
jgi:MFS family permease